MFTGFAEWLKGPNAKDVTLEVIGLVKGTKELFGGRGNMLAASNLGDVIHRAEKALKEEGPVLHPDVKRLLQQSIDTFKPVSQEPSSKGNGRLFTGPHTVFEDQDPRPEWTRDFNQARAKLDVLATRVFSHEFAPGLRAETASMSPEELAQKTKKEPEAMALLEGHLRKVRAPGA
ncbi:MAG: hypothetical protein AAF213_00750 [Pseudomonadota bacterium]